jgi:hypothetical protein
MPAAHSFLQTVDELERSGARELTHEQLWATPGGAAPVGFHLRHIAGATERLLGYARGQSLSETQIAAMKAERVLPQTPIAATALVEAAIDALRRAVDVVGATPAADADAPRSVGRARLPSTVMGLLFHAAEHAYRHSGQVMSLTKVVRG